MTESLSAHPLADLGSRGLDLTVDADRMQLCFPPSRPSPFHPTGECAVWIVIDIPLCNL